MQQTRAAGATSRGVRARQGLALLAAAATWLGCEEAGLALEPEAQELGTQASALTQVSSFGTNPGNLKMWKYVPAGLPSNAPLVVAMHGCMQAADAYTATGWNALADQWKFAVVYPAQQSGNNSSSCFNWFEPGDIARGQGEALSIKQMVDKMRTDHGIDSKRVFVTGLSAGAAMTAVMAATYPDVFAGAAIMAGVPYRCATSMNAAFSCMSPGTDKTPKAWGDLVRGAYSGYSGPWPKVSIWHGTSDYTVKNTNQAELMEQWTNVHGIDQTEDVSDTVAGYPHKVYQDSAGVARVETYAITGMGHGTPVDPQSNFPGTSVACGTAGAFVLDVDICSTYYVARFFGLDNRDAVAPTVSIGSPAPGASVSGTVQVVVDATDDMGVARVELYVDGNLSGTDTTAPYALGWNTSATTNGTHALVAKAYDAAGNVGTSSPVSVTVSGGISDTTPPTVSLTFPTAGATVSGAIDLAATASDDIGVSKVEFYIDGALVGLGVPSQQAGPYLYNWNTTSYTTGSHTVRARAYDAAGNSASSSSVTVTVDQAAASFTERFSSGGPDNAGWNLSQWSLSGDDQGGITGSQSIHGAAAAAFNTVTKTASVSVKPGASARLTYWRKVDLYGANTLATTAFRVVVNAGTDHVVDEVKKSGYGSLKESTWTRSAEVDLSAYANKTVTLKFIAMAPDTGSNLSSAKAWVDGITVGPPGESADTTEPTVNLTAPTSGSTVSGTVDLTASASDAGGVSKVEFYVDGALVGTDTSAPYVHTWDTTQVANGSHALLVKAYDAASNIGTDNDTTVTVSNSSNGRTTVSFTSLASEDGYVKAYADGSSAAVGSYSTPALGRGADSKHNRTVLSFNTSTLPDTAKVVRASLKVTYSSSSGDPWADPAGNALVVDVKSGTFGAAGMESSDWAAASTANEVASIVKFTSGTQ
ncbi:MAG TPA: PHB depolymerase family esterase, partial [Myxococcaceae bacterium]|nr:PHB depolymerase family esterase [Myxococcaceae bacterium]